MRSSVSSPAVALRRRPSNQIIVMAGAVLRPDTKYWPPSGSHDSAGSMAPNTRMERLRHEQQVALVELLEACAP